MPTKKGKKKVVKKDDDNEWERRIERETAEIEECGWNAGYGDDFDSPY